LSGVGADIDHVAEFPDMARSKKREAALFCIEHEPVALE